MNLKKLLILAVSLTFGLSCHATHQRAAEITYRHVSGLTYEFTLTMYTYTPSLADDQRDSLLMSWGDGSSSYIHRQVFNNLGNDYTLNIYRQNHTYSSTGDYTISVEDANRNYGVVNIPQSGNIAMYVETELIINPFLGNNSSPQLLNPPVDQACVNRLFVHNPVATDPDGDSLVFNLIACRGDNGYNIPGYTLPANMTVDAATGEIVWDYPTIQGEYNIALLIEEYRFGTKIGSVMRDMQILVLACDNNPPELNCPADTCITVGDTLSFDVTASDPDGVTLTSMGGALTLTVNPALVNPETSYGNPTAIQHFEWSPDCLAVRKTPYQTTFRAKDSNPAVSLTNLKTTSITVIAPAVENLTAVPDANSISLSWTPTECSNASGYYIYRKESQSSYMPDICETGVPDGLGFSHISTVHGIANSTFTDTDVEQGTDYCYRLVSFFSNGALSKSSDEACTRLTNDMPLITHVSNDSLNLGSGHLLVSWSTPKELDEAQSPPPYKYVLKRSLNGETGTTVNTAYDLNDTCFVDSQISLNNVDSVSYSIDFYTNGNDYFGSTKPAQAIRLVPVCSDNEVTLQWNCSVPWSLDSTQVFKREGAGFAELASTTGTQITDTDVTNGNSYFYHVRTFGHYSIDGIVKPIINYSAIVEATPVDNVAPQAPLLSVATDCDGKLNTLSWNAPSDDDVESYRIYYRPDNSSVFAVIDSTAQTAFTHSNNGKTVGCYYVTALDESRNESNSSNLCCIDYDACPLYVLPNVFTPNGDGLNDYFKPKHKSESVTNIELSIFNRWGRIVFVTTNADIMWDGNEQNTQHELENGTYFYTCTIHFDSLDGPRTQVLNGSVSIYRNAEIH